MKKTIFIVLAALLVTVNCFAQKTSGDTKALQGTWVLVGIVGADESYTEQAIKEEKVKITYTFSGNNVTVNNNGTIIGPVQFEPSNGFLLLGAGTRMAYNLQGKLLILFEGGFAFIYRKG